MPLYGNKIAKEIALERYPKFVDFVKRGNVYSVVQAVGILEQNERWEVLGLVWDGSRYEEDYGFRIETTDFRLCLSEKDYDDLFKNPQHYLKCDGIFDLKKVETELLDNARKNGIGSKLP